MDCFSIYSGIGGFEKGIENAQKYIKTIWKFIGYSEIDKYAEAIYRYHYPRIKNYGDATRIIPEELPDFDCLIGGFPCQSFSITGKRGGFKDTRGTLFFEIARIARIKRPSYLWLENVKGLLSHDKGNTFATIISTIDELGYDCQWQVLNSQNFGIPQNRERIFIIANIRRNTIPQIFPIIPTQKEAIGLSTLTARYYASQRNGSYIINPKNLGGNIRWLSPIECERLQGFPDNWTKYGLTREGKKIEISNSQRYKCLGNAVTTNVVRDIMLKWERL